MWQHLFIEGRRAVTGDGERPRYGLAFKKIFANGSKGIEQRAGLQADAAVHNPRPLIQRIAGADDARLLADGELELAGKHTGELFVRMVMHRADGAGGKFTSTAIILPSWARMRRVTPLPRSSRVVSL